MRMQCLSIKLILKEDDTGFKKKKKGKVCKVMINYK